MRYWVQYQNFGTSVRYWVQYQNLRYRYLSTETYGTENSQYRTECLPYFKFSVKNNNILVTKDTILVKKDTI